MKLFLKSVWALVQIGTLIGVLISVPVVIIKGAAWAATIWFG